MTHCRRRLIQVGKAGLADITDMSLRYTDVRMSNEPESHVR